MNKPHFLSDKFINYIIKSKNPSTVFLTNGVKLSGIITFNDEECIILTRDGVSQLIFRHAIATVYPQNAFSIYDLLDEKMAA